MTFFTLNIIVVVLKGEMRMILPIMPRLNNFSIAPVSPPPPRHRLTNPGLLQDTVSFKGSINEKHVNFFTELLTQSLETPGFFERNRVIIGETLEKIMPDINAGIRNNESGKRGFVSRLDDDFVVKVPHWFRNATPKCIKENCSKGILRPNKFASVEDYYGHHIMTFDNIAIMKNATAPGTYTRVGRPFEIPYASGGFRYYTGHYLPTCANLPQESFDRLAKNFKELNQIHSGRYYYEPDTENPNNFLIFNGQFRIVDDLDPIPIEEPNNLSTMVKPLLIKIATEEEAEFMPELVPMRKEILRKSIIAATRNDLPQPQSYSEEAFIDRAIELAGLEKDALEIKNAMNEKSIGKIEEIFR